MTPEEAVTRAAELLAFAERNEQPDAITRLTQSAQVYIAFAQAQYLGRIAVALEEIRARAWV